MAGAVPPRVLWAVERLAVDPDDELLEIGCGGGVAVSLICDQLTSGRITAIDRSPTMVDRATKRNEEQVASGRPPSGSASWTTWSFRNGASPRPSQST